MFVSGARGTRTAAKEQTTCVNLTSIQKQKVRRETSEEHR